MNADPAIDEVILDSKLRHINFFNGRLLTGGDLEAEQNAQLVQSRHLGRAIGDGVAFGLEVTSATSTRPGEQLVCVTKGLAVTRAGQTLRLPADQRVSLLRPLDPANRDACVFADCSAPLTSGTLMRGAGFYLLTIAPASQPEGKAPVSGLGSGSATCNSRYLTAGVKFRLLPLDVSAAPDAAHAQNHLAYQCFGLTTAQAADALAELRPGRIDARAGLVDLTIGQQLTRHDVPLAVVEWKAGSVLGFIDLWSVRRRLTQRPSTPWPLAIDDQVRSEGEARFLQFQDQITSLRGNGSTLQSVKARAIFRYLPPAGILPLAGSGFPDGINRDGFFQGMTARDPVYIEGSRLRHLLQLAADYPPIDVQNPQMVWRYIVRENAQANAGSGGPQAALVFASGQLPYLGVPQFDVSHWNYSNLVFS